MDLQPRDEFNQQLVEQVHPADWKNPRPAKRYNLVVIGAGPAGLVAAVGAAGIGAKVALIERGLVGGDCLNVGCVPSKALLRIARGLDARDWLGARGLTSESASSVDFAQAMRRVRQVRATIAKHDAVTRFTEMGIDVFLGEASFADEQTIQVEDARLHFQKALIATGARAALPPVEQLPELEPLTNETLFNLTEQPASLLVIGGGPIGCEMSQAFARLGTQVTLIEKGSRLLSKDDPEAAARIAACLQDDGVELVFETKLLRGEPAGDQKRLIGEHQGSQREFNAEEILVAAGRQPNVEALQLERAGIEYNLREGVRIDDRLRTTHRHVFAAGDVASPLKFTHAADFQARAVLANAFFFGRSKASRLVIPWTTYTSPEVAHVGLTPEAADAEGIAIDTYTQELAEVDRAILDDETTGFARVHTKRGSDKILGATVVATHAGELLAPLTLAMTHGIGLKKIGSTMYPYPTQGEAIRKLGDQLNRQRLTPFVQRLLKAWFNWRR